MTKFYKLPTAETSGSQPPAKYRIVSISDSAYKLEENETRAMAGHLVCWGANPATAPFGNMVPLHFESPHLLPDAFSRRQTEHHQGDGDEDCGEAV